MNSETAHDTTEGAPASIGAGDLSSAEQHDAAARPADGMCPDKGSARTTAVGETRVQKQHAASVESGAYRGRASRKDEHDSMRREGDSPAAAAVREMNQLQVKELQTVHARSCSVDPPKKRRCPSSGGCLDGEENSPSPLSCSVDDAFLKSSRTHSGATSGCRDSTSEDADVRSSGTAASSSNGSSIYEANASSSNARTDEGVGRDSGSPAQNYSHSTSVADVENETCSVRDSGSIHRRPSKRNVSGREYADNECNNSTSGAAADSREDRAAVNNSQRVVETGEPSVSSSADFREDAGRTSRVSEFRGGGSSSSKEKVKGSLTVTSGRSTTSNIPMDCKRTVTSDARGAGDRECTERERATVEELSKEKEGRDGAVNSFAWGLWPRPLAPSEALESPSLLLLAAAGKKFQTEEQTKGKCSRASCGLEKSTVGSSSASRAEGPDHTSRRKTVLTASGVAVTARPATRASLTAAVVHPQDGANEGSAFLETLTEEHKQQLQRRHCRVATQMLHVPPFEPLPREKFRHEAPPVLKPGVVDHSALRSYTKKLSEQEKQLKALQLHDIVFTNLYTRLRDLFPERSDAALYRMCKITCALAKRQGLPQVLEPLRRKLEDARFGVARERRKMRT